MGRTLRTKLIISTLAVSMMGSALLLAMLLAGLASRSTKAVEQSLSDQVLALSHSIEAVGTLPVAQRILASANTSDIIDQLYLIEGHTKVIKAATNRAMIGMNVRDLEDKRMIPTGATGLLGKSHLQLFTGQESNQFYVAVETKIMSDDQLFEDTYYLIGHLNAASELESVKRQLWMIIVGFLVILTVSAGVYLWGILHYVV